MNAAPKTIGELTGIYRFLLKVLLVAVPALLGPTTIWGAWVTVETVKNRAFREAGDRFTSTDAVSLELRIVREIKHVHDTIDKRIDALPPEDTRRRLDKMEAAIEALKHR